MSPRWPVCYSLAGVRARLYDPCVSALSRCAVTVLLLAQVACSSSSDETRTVPSFPTVTHAVVKLQRTRSTNATVQDQANVLFSVLRVPATLDSRTIVRMVGLSSSAPDVGQCERLDYAQTPTEATASVQHVELVDVGDVSLVASNGGSQLVRQAFPTVTDFIAGVVYTKRDLSSSPLPPATSYTLTARGAPSIPAFRIDMGTPQEPTEVRLDGTPVAQVGRFARGQSAQITWKPGVPGDRFLVEVKNSEQTGDFSCTFDDAAGIGTLPADALLNRGTVRLEFHRLRTSTTTVRGMDRVQIEFDYALDHLVDIVG